MEEPLANHKSAIKRAKQNEKRRSNNKIFLGRGRTTVKKLRKAIEEADKTEAQRLLIVAQSQMSKLAKGSMMRKKTASRRIGRLAGQVASL